MFLEETDLFTWLERPVGIWVVVLLDHGARIFVIRVECGTVPFSLLLLALFLELDHERRAGVDDEAIVIHVGEDWIEICEGFEIDF